MSFLSEKDLRYFAACFLHIILDMIVFISYFNRGHVASIHTLNTSLAEYPAFLLHSLWETSPLVLGRSRRLGKNLCRRRIYASGYLRRVYETAEPSSPLNRGNLALFSLRWSSRRSVRSSVPSICPSFSHLIDQVRECLKIICPRLARVSV